MFHSAPLLSVAAMLVTAVAPILAQATPASQGFRGDPCKGYNGLQGTCGDVDCLPLQHDVDNLPLSEFVARHGPPCAVDRSGNKLVCCPDDISKLAAESCGQSTLGRHKGIGYTDPGAWPWLAIIYYNGTGVTPDDCLYINFGALVSDRHVLVEARCIDPINEYRVVLGRYDSNATKGEQIITSSVSIRLDRWSRKYPGLALLALLVLDTPAKFVPNKVWPVCLSLSKDPDFNIGYKIDPGWTGGRQLGYFVYFPPRYGRQPGSVTLQQSHGFFVNCTIFCCPVCADADRLCPESYNVSYGNINPVCINRIAPACVNPQNFLHGSPFVVENSDKFYLVGLVSGATCKARLENADNGDMIAVKPVVKDILAIIGQ